MICSKISSQNPTSYPEDLAFLISENSKYSPEIDIEILETDWLIYFRYVVRKMFERVYMQTKLYASEKNRAEREGNTKPNTTMEVITK